MEFKYDKSKADPVSRAKTSTFEIPKFSLEALLANKGYDLPINLYSVPPSGSIDLSEAEDMVNERIKMLRVFDNKPVWTAEDWNKTAGTIKSMLCQIKDKDGVSFYEQAQVSVKKNREYRIKDHVSHFLLRLYCCTDEDMKKWFLWHETRFLQYQLMDDANKNIIKKLLQNNNMPFVCIENKDRKDEIPDTHHFFNDHPETFVKRVYRVPFLQALDVVKKRRCILNNGYAYIEETEMISIITARFKEELQRALASMRKRLPVLDENDRLLPLLKGIHHELVTKADQAKMMDGRINSKKSISPEMVDQLSKESFPPCMRNIHDNFRKNHHLKHYGRLYYQLFLKSLGMTLEDCLEFFKQEFIKTIPLDKFQKEYSYNIRYNYGREGKRVELSAYGCAKIIGSNPPGPGDAHGCPFKHFDKPNLTTLLKNYGVDDAELKEIMDQVDAKNYTGSCTKFFCGRHPSYSLKSESGIYHPNQFYVESRRAMRGFTASREKRADQAEDVFDDGLDDDTLASVQVEVTNQPENETIKASPFESNQEDMMDTQDD